MQIFLETPLHLVERFSKRIALGPALVNAYELG